MAKKKTNWFWKSQVSDTKKLAKTMQVETREDDEERYLSHYGEEDWGRSWKNNTQKTSKFNWDEYNKKGYKWEGYKASQPLTLSYSYVQQMSNAIAAEHNVKIKVGNEWNVDVKNKVLTYNPATMMFGSKGELLSTILHEVGKIKLCTHLDDLKSEKWFTPQYKKNAYQVLNAFDDFRVDDTMIKSYPSAKEVYDSQSETIKVVVTQYRNISQAYSQAMGSIIENKARDIGYTKTTQNLSFANAFKQVTGNYPGPEVNTEAKFIDKINKLVKQSYHFTNIYDYLAILVNKGYGLDSDNLGFSKEQIELFDKTSSAISEVALRNTTQEVLETLSDKVYPTIEYLLKNMSEGNEDMKSALGESGSKQVCNEVGKLMDQKNTEKFNGKYSNPQVDNKDNMKSRGQLMGKGDKIPQEWINGNYGALKDSVQSEINSLSRKLMNLRKKESTIRYENNHRRGKLNTKILYKHRQGSNRLFKQKKENIDTIRSFVFSILIDRSGSMQGSKIIHTTRATILLSEVFDKLKMPFELVYFESNAETLKEFDVPYSKVIKNKIAGVIKKADGGTNLDYALDKTKIKKREELNKVLVVLTDGEVESPARYDADYFKPMAKENIKSIVIGLECGPGIKKLNNGQGRLINNSSELPKEFYDLLNATILKT